MVCSARKRDALQELLREPLPLIGLEHPQSPDLRRPLALEDDKFGLVLELAGKFPAVNETVSIGDFDFTVLESDRNRILKVKLSIKHTD